MITRPEVRLLWSTPDPRRQVAIAARMTYSRHDVLTIAEGLTEDEVSKSVNAVLERRHLSCLRHVVYMFTVSGVSRAFSHQLVRHNVGHAYEQRSQHYRVEKDPRYVKPKSIKSSVHQAAYSHALGQSEAYYNFLVGEGIPREDARMLLPNATETQLVWTANLEGILNFVQARACRVNTDEIMQVAIQVRRIVSDTFPEMAKYLGPTCFTRGVCYEGEKFYKQCNCPWRSPTVLWRPNFPAVIELVEVGGTAAIVDYPDLLRMYQEAHREDSSEDNL